MSRFFKSLFIVNILSLILSLIYFFMPEPSIFANIFGLILILTLTGNTVAASIVNRQKAVSFVYLLLSSFGLIIVMILNTITSLMPSNQSSQSVIAIGLMLLLLIVGALFTGLTLKDKRKWDKTDLVTAKQSSESYRKTRKAILIFLSVLLFIGTLLAIVMLTNLPSGLIEAGLSPYSFFYSFIYLSLAGISLKLINIKKHPIISNIFGALGIGLYILYAVPFLSIPSMLNEAEENYTKAFSNEWKTFDDDISEFKDIPLSIPAFFFGTASEDYSLEQDVLFYEGTEGVDKELELRFDAYMPPEDAESLPGERSVLIRIHGGGWGTGGKGFFNFSQINKYFASQGYTVFDVQYGLEESGQSAVFLSGPDTVYGDFSIDDMVRHLGIFTTYLADNSDTYNADINSVFISGGSAGGQLANALTLASSSGDYPDLVDPRLTVKGLIPLYPANDLSSFRNISGMEELVDPALLVEENSPPTLVFQGDRDTIVGPQVARNFKDAYLKENNDDIAIIWMPYGAHISDIYFSGVYNQTFMYYMERFMYQYK
ncbi:MAG: alpha/beta hydrolase fold domain-containing protein [Alkalibacterium gilvum]